MNVVIKPNKLKGDVLVPPSKSLSHRAIIAASLAEGKSKISNIVFSEDINATIEAMRALGASIEVYDDYLIINGSRPKRINDYINANESGSTIRFMIPIALTVDEAITFDGKNNLVNRPLDTYTKLFDEFNIKYERGDKYLPMTVYNGLKAGIYKVEGNVSSQFITGLLFALPLLKGDSKLVITTELESKGYVDLTMDVLKMFGVNIETKDYKEFIIKGNQSYRPMDYVVEGDYSQAAFWLVANTLGNDINILGMNKESNQGDKKIIDDINSFGGNVYFDGDKLISKNADTHGTTIEFSNSPDLGPIETVLASLSKGHTTFMNIERLRIKECDRVSCMIDEMKKLGVSLSETKDTMEIDGNSVLGSSMELDSHNDHRIVMALAVASTRCIGDIRIINAGAIKKSYPHFFKSFEAVGGIVSYEE